MDRITGTPPVAVEAFSCLKVWTRFRETVSTLSRDDFHQPRINLFYEAQVTRHPTRACVTTTAIVADDCIAEIGTCAMVDDSMNDTKCADAFNIHQQHAALLARPLGCVTDVTRSFLATGEVVVPEMFVVAYFAMSCGV